MVRYLTGTWLNSSTVTHVLTYGRGTQIVSRFPENCFSKSMGGDRAPSSSGSTEVTSGSGGNAMEGSGKNSAELSLEERLEKWKNGISLDTLTDSQRMIHNCHLKAVEELRDTYKDPVTGYEVFTILTHLKRGSCCGNVCRHCPYSHANAPLSAQGYRNYNSAFYG